MVTSILDHIVLFILLFTIFFVFTKFNQSYINKHFWVIVAIPIIIYTLILGCRYGWGNDYLVYKFRYYHPILNRNEDMGFEIMNLVMNKIGFNYVGGFLTYSFIFITAAFCLIRDYKENKYMLAFFLPATILLSTFTIRQSVGHAFVFLALHFFHYKKYELTALMLAIVYSIHPGAILMIIPMLPLYYLVKKPFPMKLTIPLYTSAALLTDLFSSQVISLASQYLPMLTLENKFNNYLQNERWYGANAMNEQWKQSNLTLILSTACHVGIIYLGYIALKYKCQKKICYIYNTVVIGLITTRIFWTFEIFRRIAEAWAQLYFIPLGYGVYFFTHCYKKLKTEERIYSYCALAAILIYLFLYYGRFIFQSPKYIFIWNKL